ncbi:MAG: LptF/LptG family permease [Candidatus Bipolaricaulota bacterium]|nr:LptF/LptG family permease [Candidatus Bipolaricaulota bacterium]
MLGLVDRYLIREMVFPFVLAVAGFVLFIILNLIPQLSDFMLDRNIPIQTLFQMLAYRLPELLVYGLPVGVLFAIFWALGRLSHDRELVALQAAGFSLRRLMLPVVLMGLITTGAAFAVGELWMPWANHQYYNLLREIFFMRSSPQIRESTFVKISTTAYAYVERYDPITKKLSNVMVFDQGGGEYLAELNARFPKIIVAAEGTWDGEYWRLGHGKLHKLRDDGQFEYTLAFEKLSVRAGPFLERIFAEQRTPQEMGIAELYHQIQVLQRSRLGAESLIVELHSKIAVPFSALIFALFGAPLSLIFAQGGAPRGRAAGVIISVLLVACYQGLLLWMSTLGKRGLIEPALAPWVPNILFSVIGVLLLIWLDRLSRLDLLARLRQLFPLVLVLGVLAGEGGLAQEPPPIAFDIRADRLTVARDWSEISAEGHVQLTYERGTLSAEKVSAQRRPESQAWTVRAQGGARWEGEGLKGQTETIEIQIEWAGGAWHLQRAHLQRAQLSYKQGAVHAEEIFLQRGEKHWMAEARGHVRLEEHKDGEVLGYADAAELSLELEPTGANPHAGQEEGASWRARRATLKNFLGQTRFESAAKKQETLRFQGQKARITFREDGRIRLLEISDGEITTCTCPEPITRSAYSIAAGSVRLEPNESVLATNILVKAYGLPVFWSPVYFASLKEETKNPLLPDFGQLPERGWYLRWRIPFVIDKDNTGTVLIDYYTKLPEVGTGIEYSYKFWEQQGQISFYRLVGRGESWAIDGTHQAQLPLGMRLVVGMASRTGLLEQEAQRLFSRAQLSASWGVVRWSALWSRDQYLAAPKPESDEAVLYRFLEKAPELTIALAPWRLGPLPLSIVFNTSWGRYREKKLDKETLDESSRWESVLGVQSLALGTGFFTVQASATYRLALYEPQQLRRDAYDLTGALSLRPLPGLSADTTYTYRRVVGQSPFRFDTLSLAHRVSLRASWASVPFTPSLSGGYDLESKRFDPLRLTLRHQLYGLSTTIDLEYDPNYSLWQRAVLTLSGSWEVIPKAPALTMHLTTAYLFPRRAFEDLIVKLSWGAQRLGMSVNLNRLALVRLNLETSWQWGPDWEFSLKGEYDLPTQRVTALQVGVIKKFCHACWQVGLYSDSQRVWLHAQINAFPTAQVRYSPTDRRLSFGS